VEEYQDLNRLVMETIWSRTRISTVWPRRAVRMSIRTQQVGTVSEPQQIGQEEQCEGVAGQGRVLGPQQVVNEKSVEEY
jgi:hypothetical protein